MPDTGKANALPPHERGDPEREREVMAMVAAIRERAIASVAAEPGTDPLNIARWRATLAVRAHRPHCSYARTQGWAFCDAGCGP